MRARTVFWRLGVGVVGVATFAGAATTAVVLHAGTPAFRRVAKAITNDALARSFAGKVVVGDVEVLSIGRRGTVRARQVEVTDPEGKTVLAATNVDATIDLGRLLASLATGDGLEVDVREIAIGDADVGLDADGTGGLRLARAFAAHPTAKPAPKAAATTTSPHVHLDAISIGHAHVHGDVGGSSPRSSAPIDADLGGLTARFQLEVGTPRVVLEGAVLKLASPRAPRQLAALEGSVKGSIEIGPGGALRGSADLLASAADLAVTAHATIDGDLVDATIDVPKIEPDALANSIAGVPLKEPVTLHARVHGKLPTLGLDAEADVGAAKATATGTVDLQGKRPFSVDVDATHVDARAFGASAVTDLDGKVHVEGTLEAPPAVTFHVATSRGTAAGQRIPAATADGRLEGTKVAASFKASEPGADASGQGTYDLENGIATFDVRAKSSALQALTRISPAPSGSATAHAQGRADLKGSLQGSVDASADGVAMQMASAEHLDAHGILGGSLASPLLDVSFTGADLRLQAKGKKPLVYPDASGRAQVAFAPSPHILDASVTVRERGSRTPVSASVSEVRIGAGGLQATGLKVTGLGEPLDLDVGGSGADFHVRAKSDAVDLHTVARVTGIHELDMLPPGTRASVDVDLRPGAGGPNGHVDVVVHADKLLGDGDASAEVHATVDHGKLVGNARVLAEGFGQIEVSNAELSLPDGLDARSLARTTGTLELRGAIDLAQGGALLGENIERMAGIASFEGRIERGDPDALPAIRATFRTEGLEAVLASGSSADGPPSGASTTIAGVDLLAHVAWDGKTDDAELAVLSWDAHGLLANASGKAKLPLALWATGAKKLDPASLASLDVSGAADLPRRDLAELPAFLRLLGIRGGYDASVRVAGKLGRPEVVASADLQGIVQSRVVDRTVALEPVDGNVLFVWNGQHAVLTFGATERPRPAVPEKRKKEHAAETADLRKVRSATDRPPGYLHGLVLADLDIGDLARRGSTALPWKASVVVEGDNVSLGGLPLPGKPVGVATIHASLSDVNVATSFQATAHVDGFGANGAKIDTLDVTTGGRDGSLFASLSAADQSGADGGKATLQLASQSLLVRGVDVDWNTRAPTHIDYTVKGVRLALAAPLVRKSISELDGLVDGSGSVTLDGTSQTFDGGLAVRSATLYVNALGEEINGLTAKASFDKNGAWKVENATGKVGTGEFTAQASGRMQGFSLVDAEASIVASKGGIPLSSEAATFAEAVGEVKITAKASDDKKTLVATVEIPKANIGLPDRSPQKLESLTEDPTVAVGVRRTNGALDTSIVKKSRRSNQAKATDTGTALVTKVTVTLGKDVHLQGRGIDVSLGGQTLVQIADQLKVTGKIELKGGSIEVHGRRFTIDRGTVSFLEGSDASNPTVIAAAYWDSPDGTKVWVEFAGPIKTGTLSLRSEPPYSKTEILSVLLFGRPDPNMAAASPEGQSSGDTSGATAIGTGIVADDLNRVLSDIDDNLDIETDSLDGNLRTKLGRSFLDKRLKVQIGYSPGTSYREPDTTYVFLNWQFIPKWSLVATRGDKGTSILDVLFQHRY